MLGDDDLLDAAERDTGTRPTRALLIDWQALGLVEAHSPGRGRGRGRDPRQWSRFQRDLFLLLLRRRARGDGTRSLEDVVVSRWLLRKPVSTIQARRSLATWARDPQHRRSDRVARELAAELLRGVYVSEREQLAAPVAAALRAGEPLPAMTLDVKPRSRSHFREALRTVTSDEEATTAMRLLLSGQPPPDVPWTVDAATRAWFAVAGIAALPHASDEALEHARDSLHALDRGRTAGAAREVLEQLGRASVR